MLRSIQELGYSSLSLQIDPLYDSYTFFTSDRYAQSKQWISHWELIGIRVDAQTALLHIILTNIDEEQLDKEGRSIPQNTPSFISFTPDGLIEIIDFFTLFSSISPTSKSISTQYFTLLSEEDEKNYKLQRKSGPNQKLYRYMPPIHDLDFIYIISFPYWNPAYETNQRASLSFIQFHPQQLKEPLFWPRRDGKKEPFIFSQDSFSEFLLLLPQFLY